MKKRVSELVGAGLDYSVAAALGIPYQGYTVYNEIGMESTAHAFSTEWEQAGPIIDREEITWSMNMEPEHDTSMRYLNAILCFFI